MNTYIKNHLLGGLEYCLFMPGAVPRFKNDGLKDALFSFLPPLLLLPYGIYGITLSHNTELQTLSDLEGINNFSTPAFIGITFVKSILMTIFGLLVMYSFAKVMKRQDRFWSFISAANWKILPGALFTLPVFLMLFFGYEDTTALYFVATLTMIYGYAVSAFVITYALNVPWELGTAMMIFFLFVGEAADKAVSVWGASLGG
jgi:hypothetical protein